MAIHLELLKWDQFNLFGEAKAMQAVFFRSVARAIIASLMLSGYAYSGSVVVEDIDLDQPALSTTDDKTVGDQATDAWDATKEAAGSAADYSVEKGGEILDSTKQGVAKGADYVGTKSSEAWEATKKGAANAADATTEAAGTAWVKSKEVADKAVDYTSEKIEAASEALFPASQAPTTVQDKSVN